MEFPAPPHLDRDEKNISACVASIMMKRNFAEERFINETGKQLRLIEISQYWAFNFCGVYLIVIMF